MGSRSVIREKSLVVKKNQRAGRAGRAGWAERVRRQGGQGRQGGACREHTKKQLPVFNTEV
jgi:hypothetical protein